MGQDFVVRTGFEPVRGTRCDAYKSGAVLFPYAYSITHLRVAIAILPPDYLLLFSSFT
jgi:hypothetical protein